MSSRTGRWRVPRIPSFVARSRRSWAWSAAQAAPAEPPELAARGRRGVRDRAKAVLEPAEHRAEAMPRVARGAEAALRKRPLQKPSRRREPVRRPRDPRAE